MAGPYPQELLLSILDGLEDGITVLKTDEETGAKEVLFENAQAAAFRTAGAAATCVRVLEKELTLSSAVSDSSLASLRIDATTSDGRPGAALDAKPKSRLILQVDSNPITSKVVRVVLQSTPEMCFVADCATGSAVIVNKKYDGFSTERLEDFMAWAKLLHPEDQQAAVAAWADSMMASKPLETTYRLLKKEGGDLNDVVWIKAKAGHVFNPHGKSIMLMGILMDQTEIMSGRQLLAHEQSFLRTAIDAVPVGVAIARKGVEQDSVVVANKENERIWRTDAVPLIGLRDYSDYILFKKDGSRLYPDEWPMVRSITTGEVVTEEDYTFHRFDGTVGIITYSSSPVIDKASGAIIGAVTVTRDVTDKLSAEKERTARLAAEQAETQMRRMVANVSHEIRTPIAGVIGLASLLEDSVLDEDQRELIEGIRESGQLLLSVINDLLDHSKIAAGKMDLEKKPFDLQSLIRNTLAMTAEMHKVKDLQLITRFDPSLPAAIVGSELRFKQVLLNLLSNAAKFTPPGGTITLEGRAEAWRSPDKTPVVVFDEVLLREAISDPGIITSSASATATNSSLPEDRRGSVCLPHAGAPATLPAAELSSGPCGTKVMHSEQPSSAAATDTGGAASLTATSLQVVPLLLPANTNRIEAEGASSLTRTVADCASMAVMQTSSPESSGRDETQAAPPLDLVESLSLPSHHTASSTHDGIPDTSVPSDSHGVGTGASIPLDAAEPSPAHPSSERAVSPLGSDAALQGPPPLLQGGGDDAQSKVPELSPSPACDYIGTTSVASSESLLPSVQSDKRGAGAGASLFCDVAEDEPSRPTELRISTVNPGKPACQPSVMLHFSLRDTGIGLTKDQMSRLFRPFMQADTSTTRQYGGTGLGLALCRDILELMGGSISVESEGEGKGSCFHFSFTAELATLEPPHEESLESSSPLSFRPVLLDPLRSEAHGFPASRTEHVTSSFAKPGIEATGSWLALTAEASPASHGIRPSRLEPLVGMAQAAFADGSSELAFGGGGAGATRSRHSVTTSFDEISPTHAFSEHYRPSPGLQSLPPIATGARPAFSFVSAATLSTSLASPSPRLRHLPPLEKLMPEGFATTASASDSAATSSAPHASSAIETRPPRILVVDDVALNRTVARRYLQKLGYNDICIACNGSEAVTMVRDDAQGIDIVLMDLMMPVMGGAEAAVAIKALPIPSPPPVVAVSAATNERDRLGNLFFDWLPKPFSAKELRDIIEKCLTSRPALAAVSI